MRIGDRVKVRDGYKPAECSDEQWAQRAMGMITDITGPRERELIDIDFGDLGSKVRKTPAVWYDVFPAPAVAADDAGL